MVSTVVLQSCVGCLSLALIASSNRVKGSFETCESELKMLVVSLTN